MGDLEIWPPTANGILIDEEEEDNLFLPPPSLASSSPPNPDPICIDSQCWSKAEETTQEIICKIQPTVVSEHRRQIVIQFIQNLIRGYLGCEVCPFGSVPLKTYLPDGDIDLTALSIQNVEDALANDVRIVLETEERNKSSEFEVKDVQYIQAEVKLVKCLVQNIIVDISFNQIGGLSTLCFLEQVDRRIGKDHLFKRSIILIKAWCYYESRILGAHHGLISTYALETLVLYIFHLFHSSLNGPLAVLYRFLDYYSKFDWDNYCISLNGPVNVRSLPEIVAEAPDNGGGELLLSEEFLRRCANMYALPSKGLETNSRAFTQKYLNIVDPLKDNNNLGRSVSKGNFFRIRSAFSYGARKLGRILLLPVDIHDELTKFFGNTLDRHGTGVRPDVQDSPPDFSAYGSQHTSYQSSTVKCDEGRRVSALSAIDPDLHGMLNNRIRDIDISGMERDPLILNAVEVERCTDEAGYPSQAVSSAHNFEDENAVLGCSLVGNAKELASSRSKSTSTSLTSESDTPNVLSSLNDQIGSGDADQTKVTNSGAVENMVPHEKYGLVYSCYDYEGGISSGGREDVRSSEYSDNGYGLVEAAETDGSPRAPRHLSELTGDYDSHHNSLVCAQWYQGIPFWGSAHSLHPAPPQFRNKQTWDSNSHQGMPVNRMLPHMNSIGVTQGGPQFFPAKSSMTSGTSFGAEEMQKPRGTGTFLPNATNYRSNRERSFPGKGRNSAFPSNGNYPRSPRENGWVVPPSETNLFDNGSSHELPPRNISNFPGRGIPAQLEVFQNGPPTPRGLLPHSNGFVVPEKVEFGTFGNMPSASPTQESSRQLPSGGALQYPVPVAATQRPRPSLTIDTEKVPVQSYHMKDDDFPPLSV
ncbi:hypothetical protein C5167_002236 [Papaver somniferum]|uniref:Polymerase nucleotidyl transferase domain-containing protein n=1 Tax=Papaver somniferum TaxID=3469 RepID=A0A4Y7L1A3_PAPSO|nr:uncharacterized protein LOC113308726 [Papaver somniferum]RZC77999.1 hypothetical protein C5167_002236 [Papaver somniferum]